MIRSSLLTTRYYNNFYYLYPANISGYGKLLFLLSKNNYNRRKRIRKTTKRKNSRLRGNKYKMKKVNCTVHLFAPNLP
jgi:hypothetical protein